MRLVVLADDALSASSDLQQECVGLIREWGVRV